MRKPGLVADWPMRPNLVVQRGSRTPIAPFVGSFCKASSVVRVAASVFVHSAIDKADGGDFRCTLDGAAAGRLLEIPAWMFDRAACVTDVRSLTDPSFVSLEALGYLVRTARPGVEDWTAPSSNRPASRRIWDLSRPESEERPMAGKTEFSDRDPAQASALVPQQMDMFASRVVLSARRQIGPTSPRGRTGGAARADDTPDPQSMRGRQQRQQWRGRP